jgi:hypothetical protein
MGLSIKPDSSASVFRFGEISLAAEAWDKAWDFDASN